MNSEPQFFICNHCGNLIHLIENAGVPIGCCGEPMHRLHPNTAEAAQEKHLPVSQVEGNVLQVSVGSTHHPMSQEHAIRWVYLQTQRGGQLKYLQPDEAPQVHFTLDQDKSIALYAYCNLHGLWKAEV